jgi:hypothetical protein
VLDPIVTLLITNDLIPLVAMPKIGARDGAFEVHSGKAEKPEEINIVKHVSQFYDAYLL